ncbi:hypothetical protein HCG51_26400 [Tolypothrix sp. PCC 7910]|uniref:hypothetical protein n=1 Tax=Tolypothrix sp. PCC 7910 TaxID=2099387 RepID=UPI0014278FFE|nr:hypothetical protein [Tolypothrix sp. PCC 7910]QIR39889.1 hypothetical protein HCG51_26400 [Tolypothrix sp. PCC 7910]
MGRIKLWIIGLISFFTVLGSTFCKRAIALFVCGIFSINSPTAYMLGDNSANAAVPSFINESLNIRGSSNHILNIPKSPRLQAQNNSPNQSIVSSVVKFSETSPQIYEMAVTTANACQITKVINATGKIPYIESINFQPINLSNCQTGYWLFKFQPNSRDIEINLSDQEWILVKFITDKKAQLIYRSASETEEIYQVIYKSTRVSAKQSLKVNEEKSAKNLLIADLDNNVEPSLSCKVCKLERIVHNTLDFPGEINDALGIIASLPLSISEVVWKSAMPEIIGSISQTAITTGIAQVQKSINQELKLADENADCSQFCVNKTAPINRGIKPEIPQPINPEKQPEILQPSTTEKQPEIQNSEQSNPVEPESNKQENLVSFPLHNIVGISTINNAQSLTFTPISFGNQSFSPNKPVIAHVLSQLNFASQEKGVKLNKSLETQFPIKTHKIAQIAGINSQIPDVPDTGNSVIQEAVLSQVAKQLPAVIDAELPIKTSLQDAYPTVSQLPGAEFTPLENNLEKFYRVLNNGKIIMELPPGDYSISTYVFSMKYFAYAPGESETFLLAPLNGKQANAIAALNSRFVARGIERDTIQSLSWAIQAGTKYEELSTEQQAIVQQLIPEYKEQLSKTFWDTLQNAWGKVASTFPGAPSLKNLIGQLGPTAEMLKTFQKARDIIQQYGDDYNGLESAIVLPGNADSSDYSPYPRGLWSKISDRIYARLLPTNLGSPGTLDIRILDAD